MSLHVFRTSVRDRVLFSSLAFAIGMVVAALLVDRVTAGQDLKILKDLGLAAIDVAGLVIAVLIGVGVVTREIRAPQHPQRPRHTALSLGVHRR